jgi:hypothetical protein
MALPAGIQPVHVKVRRHAGLFGLRVNTHIRRAKMNTTTPVELPAFEDFKGITSVYELRRTLELEVKSHLVRIELWYWHSNPSCRWEARVYRRNEGAETWKQWTEFPWVQERDEDTAIRQALNFIEERYQDKTGGGFQRTVSK